MNYARKNITAMAGYTPGEQPQDRRYIKLNTNENPYPPSPRLVKALQEFDAARLRLYPDPLCTELRAAAARVTGLDPAWILCGNGSDDLLTIAVRTFVDQGGRLAHFEPSYSLYPVLAGLQGAGSVAVPLVGDGFEVPGDAARQAAGCSLFLVARPNAPTGNAFPLAAMHTLCREFPGVVWIDEAYVDFCPDNCLEFLKQYPNVIVSRSFSKSYSLAGLRLGFAFARPELTEEMYKVKDSYNVSMLTQVLGKAAFEDQDYLKAGADKICRTRDWTMRELKMLGCRPVPSAANFLFVRTPQPAGEVFRSLRENGILVRYFPGRRTGDYLRITIGTDEQMRELVSALRTILEG